MDSVIFSNIQIPVEGIQKTVSNFFMVQKHFKFILDLTIQDTQQSIML